MQSSRIILSARGLSGLSTIFILGGFFLPWFRIANRTISGVAEGGPLWLFVLLSVGGIVTAVWPTFSVRDRGIGALVNAMLGWLLAGAVFYQIENTRLLGIRVRSIFDLHWKVGIYLLLTGLLLMIISGLVLLFVDRTDS